MSKFVRVLVLFVVFVGALVYAGHYFDMLDVSSVDSWIDNAVILGAYSILVIIVGIRNEVARTKRKERKRKLKAFAEFYLMCETTIEERALPNEWINGTPDTPLTVFVGHLDTPIGKAVFVGMRKQQVVNAFKEDMKALAERYYIG